MNKKVYHIRLINGDEIISEIDSENKTSITIINPLVVEELKNPETGTSSIILSKYSLSDDSNIKINKNHIMTLTTVNDAIMQYYMSSLVYNEKYIEQNKINEIKKVTEYLNGIISNKPNGKLIIKKDKIDSSMLHLGSNTIN